jgi:phosphate starvation-inducible protein PhoH
MPSENSTAWLLLLPAHRANALVASAEFRTENQAVFLETLQVFHFAFCLVPLGEADTWLAAGSRARLLCVHSY